MARVTPTRPDHGCAHHDNRGDPPCRTAGRTPDCRFCFALLVVFALIAAACGGNDGDGGDDAGGSTSTAADEGGETTHRPASSTSPRPRASRRSAARSCSASSRTSPASTRPLAVAAYLHRRAALAVALVAVAAAVHSTTAALVCRARGGGARRQRAVVAACGDSRGAGRGRRRRHGRCWRVPLRGRLVVMDDLWLQAVASKDSLFATEWPLSAWAINLGTLGVLWLAYRFRAARGLAGAEERGLVWGATALVAVFLITLPAVAARVAFPVQLQISRVFWLVDVVATIAIVGAAAEARVARASGPARVGRLPAGAGRGTRRLHPVRRAPRAAALQPASRRHALARGDAVRGDAAERRARPRRLGARLALRDERAGERRTATSSSKRPRTRRWRSTRATSPCASWNGSAPSATSPRARRTTSSGSASSTASRTWSPTGRLPLPPVFENAEFRVYALAPPVRLAGGAVLR